MDVFQAILTGAILLGCFFYGLSAARILWRTHGHAPVSTGKVLLLVMLFGACVVGVVQQVQFWGSL